MVIKHHDLYWSRRLVINLYAQRGSFLAVLVVLSQDIAQHLGHAVHAQLPADGQRTQQLHRSRLAQQRLEGQRDPGEALRRGHFVKLASVLEGQCLAIFHRDFSAVGQG